MNRDIPISMTSIPKLFAWLLAAAVTFATLGPPALRPHSHFGQDGEHALAFILIGLAFGLAYTRNRLLTSAISVVMIGVLGEYLGRILEEARGRPLYIVERTLGLAAADRPAEHPAGIPR